MPYIQYYFALVAGVEWASSHIAGEADQSSDHGK